MAVTGIAAEREIHAQGSLLKLWRITNRSITSRQNIGGDDTRPIF
ncbi:hypothetical protein TMatcc_003690 [Talaromyces marneffei ATCC 18224]